MNVGVSLVLYPCTDYSVTTTLLIVTDSDADRPFPTISDLLDFF
jgi:hypothetical protein